MPFGQIGRVCGNLVGHDALAHIVAIRQAQMFLGRDVTQHGGAVPSDLRCADGGGDVIVAGRDIRSQWAQRIEWRFEAFGQLLVHVFLDELHGHVSRPLDHHLDIVPPGDLGQLSQRPELGELCGIIGIGNRPGAKPIAQ